MPYKSINELPTQVKDNLPKHAQSIYKSSFNSAYDSHEGEEDREETAHRIAWSAVKTQYEKDENGNWIEK